MARFSGKTVIITGAGSGLGQATALRLAQEDANLVLVDMSADGLEETKTQVESAGAGGVELVTANVTKSEDVQKYVDTAVSTFGSIDGFFDNAGIEGKQNLTEEFGDDEFAKVLAVNLTGVFAGMAAVLKQMRKQGSGSIVNTASVESGFINGTVVPIDGGQHAMY